MSLARERTSSAAEQRAEFERLLQPLLMPLYNAALAYLGHAQDAEDLVAETVARALRGFSQFESGTNFKAWVFRILTNLCINRHRHDVRTPETVGYDELEREADVAGSTLQARADLPDAALLAEVLDEEIEAALAGLSEEFRMVVILADVHELPYQEIAESLGIPVGTVRSRLSRGRHLLRRALAGYAAERGLTPESSRD